LRCKLFRQFTVLPTGNASGHINCEVTGFVLSGPGLPTVYLKNVADRVRGIDVAVLFAGGERADQRTRSTADP
jgi:hypothetical protein